MEITKEFLKSNFKCDNPDFLFPRYYKRGEKPDWRISVEPGYIPGSNKIGYSVSSWRCDESGSIVKRCQAGYIKTTEELDLILKLTGNDKEN